MAYLGSNLLANEAFFPSISMVCYQAFVLPMQHFERRAVLGPILGTQLNWGPMSQQDTASSSEGKRDPRLSFKCFWLERVDSAFRRSKHDSVK